MSYANSKCSVTLGWIAVILIVSLFLFMAGITPFGGLPSNLRPILTGTSVAVFMIAWLMLWWAVWKSLRTFNLSKMEAWWWLFTPYAVGYPSGVLLFSLQEFGHPLAPFVLLSVVATVSSCSWAAVFLLQLLNRRFRNVTTKQIVMLIMAPWSLLLWLFMRKS
jgi:hypothetical protein